MITVRIIIKKCLRKLKWNHEVWRIGINKYYTDENCKKGTSTENVKVNDNEIKQKQIIGPNIK